MNSGSVLTYRGQGQGQVTVRSNKKSFKNAKNQYIRVFEDGDHESGLSSDVSRLRSRSRSGQGHGKVKATNHCKLYTERKLMTWRMLW